MEHRQDLEKLLLDSLPPQQREHVVKMIRKTTADKLARKRSEPLDANTHDTD